ncbi:hypothetical protein [Natrarchaeobaculum aegyptiacum]|nr:hypothetical protein [Natrarchaeobaculum aegyptiacum]
MERIRESMAYIQIVVSDEQKSRWSDHVEDDPAVDSMSDLVRTAVEKHMARDDSEPEAAVTTQAVEGELDDIEARLGTLEDKLDLLRLENVEEDQLEGIVENIAEQYAAGTSDTILNELGADPDNEWPNR